MAARANKSRRIVYAIRAKKSRRVDLAAGADTSGQVELICLEGRLGHWSRYEWTWLPVDKSRLAISADKSGCVNLATGVKMSRWVDLATRVNRSTRVNFTARADTSRCIDLAAIAQHLDWSTWPPEPIRLDRSNLLPEQTSIDG